jgi:hypothetical protein
MAIVLGSTLIHCRVCEETPARYRCKQTLSLLLPLDVLPRSRWSCWDNAGPASGENICWCAIPVEDDGVARGGLATE